MLESNQPVSPSEISSERKKEIISKIAKNIVDRRLTAPAIMFLESIKPMNFVGAQVMIFFEPIILTFFNINEYREASLILEERNSIENLIMEIENYEDNSKTKKSVKEDK